MDSPPGMRVGWAEPILLTCWLSSASESLCQHGAIMLAWGEGEGPGSYTKRVLQYSPPTPHLLL